MELASNIDPAGVIEGAFTGMFQTLFHMEGARQYLGFSNISAFSNEDDLSGWYLWFEDIDGSFQIELAQTGLLSIDEHKSESGPFSNPLVQGSCSMRYYPSEKEDTFETYSCYEQVIRLGPLFDHTGTPTPEGRRKIPKSYFKVGEIGVRMSLSRKFMELECVAPERWVDVRTDGLYLNAPGNKEYEAVAPGERDRNVPGWSLSHFLLNKMILGFCLTLKTAPLAVLFSKERGFSFSIDKRNRVTKNDNSDMNQFRLIIGLDTSRDYKKRKEALINGYVRDVRTRLREHRGKIVEIWQEPKNVPLPWIISDWWKVKEMEFGQEGVSQYACFRDH
jgi:hypothetical protein